MSIFRSGIFKRPALALAAVVAGLASVAVVAPAAGLVSAEDLSGGACTDLDWAIDYRAWRAGTTDASGRPTSEAVGSQRYLSTLYSWYHPNNCNVALGKNRPDFPPCYLSTGCSGNRDWGGGYSDDGYEPVLT
jgi:hypothetical protein